MIGTVYLRQELAAKIEAFCAACEGRGRIDLIHDDHAHLVWKEAIRRGKRFLPDFTQLPFGIFELGTDGTMNGATAQTDLANFRNAVRFYSISHKDIINDRWPDGLDSDVMAQPVPPDVTVPPGSYASSRDIAATFYANQYFIMSHDSSLDDTYVSSYRRHCEMNLLAVLRPENWENQGIIDSMIEGQVTAANYLSMSSNPIHTYWSGHDHTAWRRGYIRYSVSNDTYEREPRPLDLNDPVTLPESADSRGDDRVSTYVQVILESEIDRSDTSLRAPMHPWIAEELWVGRVNEILGGAE